MFYERGGCKVMDVKTDVALTDGAAAKKKGRAYVRKPNAVFANAVDWETTNRWRRQKPAQEPTSIFGAHSAQFDLMVLRAGIAKTMKAHLEAMQAEFGELAKANQDAGARVIAAMAQSGMNALQELELPKPGDAGQTAV